MFSYDLLRSIVDTVKASDGTLSEVPCLIGLRDRALISVMTFTFARVSAAVGMRVEDYYPKGKRWWVRLHEKGGKRHDLPAHHNLETYLDAYIEAAGIREMDKSPLFRAALGRTGRLGENAMHRIDAWAMIQRRAAAINLRVKIGCHTFRATGITAYLSGGGTLEKAQTMAAHESPRTTKLYDRTRGHFYWVGEFSGTFFNDKGENSLINRAGVKCPAWDDQDLNNKKAKFGGVCTVTDLDGDAAYVTFQGTGIPGVGKGGPGTFEWTGGTGKYKEIVTAHVLSEAGWTIRRHAVRACWSSA